MLGAIIGDVVGGLGIVTCITLVLVFSLLRPNVNVVVVNNNHYDSKDNKEE